MILGRRIGAVPVVTVRGPVAPVRGASPKASLGRGSEPSPGRGGARDGAHRESPAPVVARVRVRSMATASSPLTAVTAATPRVRRGEKVAASRVVRGPQRERHQPDYLILLAVVALGAVGILMVYSTSGVGSYLREAGDAFSVVGPQLMWGSLGLVMMVVVTRLDYRWWRLVSLPMYLVALVLLLVVLAKPIGPFTPIVVGGSARWLEIGPLPAMHPAEFAKLALIVYVAHFLARKGGKSSSLVHGMLPFLVIAGPVIALVAREPDLGTTGVLTLSAFMMFFVAGARLWQLLLLLPAGIAAVVWYVNDNAYQMTRVVTFLDPWKDPSGAGYHTVQGLLALGQGGILGTGLGESRQAGALALPNAQNDYIFGVVGQELGLIGGVLVIALYLFLAYRGMRVALAAPDTFGALMATGITAWLTFQAFINIGVVTALLPITGITLPFVSLGGSSLLVSFAAVGILLSISRETQPRGTWNDADPDRGRWHWRPHLPGPGRGARDPEPTGGR